MRTSVIVYLLGVLLIVLGFSQVLPFVCSLYFGESEATIFIFTASLAITVGFVLTRLGQRATSVSPKEGFLLVTLAWTIAAVWGALPFYLSGTTNFLNGFFESMSGFTTTGATILQDIESVPYGILFWRSFTHWLGGMGIIALFVALMPRLGAGGMNLLRAEVPGPSPERMTPRVAQTAKLLWGIYIGLTVTQILMLLASGLSFFDAATHTFATLATGGFSTKNDSVAGLNNPAAEFIIIIFMIIAGGNFALYYGALLGHWRDLIRDREFRFYVRVLGLGTLVIGLSLWIQANIHTTYSLRKALFHVVSITTTTGFSTHDFEGWPQIARLTLLFLMLIGGCRGSTGGGAKQIRIMVLLKYAYRELTRALHPRAVVPIKLGRESVNERIVGNILGFLVLYGLILFITTFALTAMRIDLVSAFSAAAACLGNIGPGLGLVGPIETYLTLPPLARFILPFVMLLGRLEIYTVLVLFLPDFIQRRSRTIS